MVPMTIIHGRGQMLEQDLHPRSKLKNWSDDASLASLTTSIGSLHPEFDPSTHFYVLEFAANFSRVKTEADPSDEEATVSGTFLDN